MQTSGAGAAYVSTDAGGDAAGVGLVAAVAEHVAAGVKCVTVGAVRDVS